MATVLDVQAGFQGTGSKPQWGVDAVTGALVPNPLNSGTVDIGAADALVRTIYSSLGLSSGAPLLTSTAGATMKPFFLEEEMTLATGAATTDSTANLLPANSIILAVVSRVTVAVGTAVNYALGDGTVGTRFAAANTSVAAGDTGVGLSAMFGVVNATNAGPTQASAAKLRITCNANASAGKIRVCVIGFTFTAPTS